jgi:hypothetical protein
MVLIKEAAMEWVLVAVVLTEAPNFTQSHSYYIPTFASQKLCDEALANMQGEFGKPTEKGAKITVRATCFQRKP